MALLDELLDKRCRLIDYECVREGGGGSTARLIAFGGFAGKAGIINGLRGLGLRLLGQGYSTPFLAIGPAYSYQDYNQAKQALAEVGGQIATGGLPAAVSPLVTTICGTGNVSKGAIDALGSLGDVVRWVTPAELPGLTSLHGTEGEHQRHVYACVVGTEHLVAHGEVHEGSPHSPHSPHAAGAHRDSRPFERSHYYANPHEYIPTFHATIAPHTSLLVPTMYWDRRFPRLLTLEQLAELRASGNSRLLAVADLTCDVGGAVESLVRSSTIDAPYYVYDVEARAERTDGLDGNGVLMMGVDILPSELPKEASQHFGDLLFPFVSPLTTRGAPLPAELAGATIVDAGRLRPAYQYIQAMREAYDRSQEAAQAEAAARGGTHLTPQQLLALEGSTVLSLPHGPQAATPCTQAATPCTLAANPCIRAATLCTEAATLCKSPGALTARSPLQPPYAPRLQPCANHQVLSLHGHLFDSGVINAALDLIEQAGDSHLECSET
jgi:alpha-aminoadipic semialdehyde synthase